MDILKPVDNILPIANIGINVPKNGLVFNLDANVTNQFEL